MLEEFPSCCGATIVHDLSRGISSEILSRTGRNHLLLAITEISQLKAISQLKKAGWVPVRKFRNNRLTLWINPVNKKINKRIKK